MVPEAGALSNRTQPRQAARRTGVASDAGFQRPRVPHHQPQTGGLDHAGAPEHADGAAHRLAVGTDMGGDFWYHRELELYTKAGMTNAQVLKRATADVQDYLGRGKEYGAITPSMKADFMLLPGDPVADIKAINRIAMVVKNGTVYFPSEIYDKMGVQPFAAPPAVSGAGFAR